MLRQLNYDKRKVKRKFTNGALILSEELIALLFEYL